MNESTERPKIPRQLTDRFTNLTKENKEFNACRSCRNLSLFLCASIQVSFKAYCQFEYKEFVSAVTRRRSGWNVLSVIMQGQRRPGKSTYKVASTMD